MVKLVSVTLTFGLMTFPFALTGPFPFSLTDSCSPFAVELCESRFRGEETVPAVE
jgi:hypothetical protein